MSVPSTEELVEVFTKNNEVHQAYVRYFIDRMIEDIEHRRDIHDDSKLSPEEILGFANGLPYLENSGIGEDMKMPPDISDNLNKAVAHHYQVNDHHPEYFENLFEGMDLMTLIELVADWRAAMIRSGNTNYEASIQYGMKKYKMPEYFANILRNTFQKLEKYVHAAEEEIGPHYFINKSQVQK